MTADRIVICDAFAYLPIVQTASNRINIKKVITAILLCIISFYLHKTRTSYPQDCTHPKLVLVIIQHLTG